MLFIFVIIQLTCIWHNAIKLFYSLWNKFFLPALLPLQSKEGDSQIVSTPWGICQFSVLSLFPQPQPKYITFYEQNIVRNFTFYEQNFSKFSHFMSSALRWHSVWKMLKCAKAEVCTMAEARKITVLDSTLRDGAQGEGISFSVQDFESPLW